MSKRTYIGDGAYAEYDGFQLCLSADRGRSEPDQVYLDPHVLDSLFRFLERAANVKITVTPVSSAEGA